MNKKPTHNMKPIHKLLLGLACAAGSAGAAAAADGDYKVKVNWDQPDAVTITLGGINKEALSLPEGSTTFELTEPDYVYVRPAEGYILKEVKDNTGAARRISGTDKYGQYCSLSLWSSDNGSSFDVATEKLVATGAFGLDVANGADKVSVYLLNGGNSALSTYSRPGIKEGGTQVPLTAYDTQVVIAPANGLREFYSLRKNGIDVGQGKWETVLDIADGDRIEVTPLDPAVEIETCKVSFSVNAQGEGAVASIFNNQTGSFVYTYAPGQTSGETVVDKGSKLRFNFNTDYVIEGFAVNGEPVEVAEDATSVVVTVDKDIEVAVTASAKVYQMIATTLYVNNPAGIEVLKSADAGSEAIDLGAGTLTGEPMKFAYSNGTSYTVPKGVTAYKFDVDGKSGKYFVHVKPGYWLEEIVLANPEDPEYIYSTPGVSAANGPAYVNVRKIANDMSAVVSYEGADGAARMYASNKTISGRLAIPGLESDVLPAGYTDIAFDHAYHQSFSIGKSGGKSTQEVVVYLNGRKLSIDQESQTYIFGLTDGAVVKAFLVDEGEAPARHRVTFEVAGGCSAKVMYDKNLEHADLGTVLEGLGKTLVSVMPAAGTAVMVDGTEVKPDAEGVCSFVTSKSRHTVSLVDAGNAGVDGIGADSVSGRIYDLNGVEMPRGRRLPAGIYIMDGRKVVVK